MGVCIGCKKEIKIEFSQLTILSDLLCDSCKANNEKELLIIRENALENIERNGYLNNLFDEVLIKEKGIVDGTIVGSQNTNDFCNASIDLRKYMYSLLEEVHQFTYHACFECVLYSDFSIIPVHKFFSERYFLQNAVLKTIAAWEKLIKFYALYYEVTFDDKEKRNTLTNLQKSLFHTDFRQTQIYERLYRLKSDGVFKQLDDARKSYDHNLSSHLNGTFNLTLIAQAIILNGQILYNGLEEALDLYNKRSRIVSSEFVGKFTFYLPEEDLEVFSEKAQRIKQYYKNHNLHKTNGDIFNRSVQYIKLINLRFDDMVKWSTIYTAPPLQEIYNRLFDVIIRIHESSRSISYMTNMFKEAVLKGNHDLDSYYVYFNGMNYRYFLLGSLLRIYSVYDKLAVIIQKLFEVNPKQKTFESTVEYIKQNEKFINSLPPMKLCNKIIKNRFFKKLYESRQEFSHYLTAQNYLSPNYKEILDTEILIAIQENTKLIYKLIESLDLSLIHFHRMAQSRM